MSKHDLFPEINTTCFETSQFNKHKQISSVWSLSLPRSSNSDQTNTVFDSPNLCHLTSDPHCFIPLEPSVSDTMSQILICTILTLGLISTMAVAMRFELESGATKCISDEIKSNSMTVGKYSIVNPNEGFPLPDSHKLTVRVTSPYGNNFHHGDLVNSGNFAFTAAETGDYSACFWVTDHKPKVTVTIDFDWKTGVAAKDWSKVAKKGQIELMELELKKLFDTVTAIHDEMFYLREREEEMQQLNRSTNSKMATFSFLSLVVCLSVAGLQLWHLKMFFERKKLL